MSFPMFVAERLSAAIGAVEFTHIEHVADLSGNFHLLELGFAQWAHRISGKPLVETRSADEPFTVAARGEVLQNVGADRTTKLLEDLFELWFGMLES